MSQGALASTTMRVGVASQLNNDVGIYLIRTCDRACSQLYKNHPRAVFVRLCTDLVLRGNKKPRIGRGFLLFVPGVGTDFELCRAMFVEFGKLDFKHAVFFLRFGLIDSDFFW